MLTILAEAALRSFVLGGVVWLGLSLFRVRNPHVHMASWTVVLAASLAMPLLMQWARVTITLQPLPMPAPAHVWPSEMSLPDMLGTSLSSEVGIPSTIRGVSHSPVDWWAVATAIYVFVSGMLLLRLAIGICLTWRLAREAKPLGELRMSESCAFNADIRVSDEIGGPVTFGSTILVPPEWTDWDVTKRRAVLAHEGAHVANRDFYVLLLASLNRAVFWFSPFAWWQLKHMAELAEAISDAGAIEVLEDKLSYAEFLLELVRHARQRPLGLQMARAGTVGARIERILAAAAMPSRVGWRKRISIAAAIAPLVVVSAGSIAYRTLPQPVAAVDGADEAPAMARKPQHVDFYAIAPTAIFAIFHEGDDLFGQLTGQPRVHLAAMGDGAYAYPATAGPITFALGDERQPSALKLHQNGRDLQAARIAEALSQDAKVDAALFDEFVGWYELSPSRVLAVTRSGYRIHVQETGRSGFEVAAIGTDAFSSRRDDLLIFLRDDQAEVTRVLLQDPMSGARLARRVDAARAKVVEANFAQRMAEVSDRFREQAPAPGTKDALLRGIEDLRRGAPNYDRMSAGLAAAIRRQVPQLQATIVSLGKVESVFFRGVGPVGYDIYGVKFANGTAEFRLVLGADGKVDDVLFRPDGNDEPGSVAACSDEPHLRSRDGGSPIKVMFYNDSGDDIQLYNLDSEGHRLAHGTIGDSMSSWILTSVDSPWVVVDRSGQCLEIVLPGRRTRYNAIGNAHTDGLPEHLAPLRTTPLAGSEERLRQYILSLGRGQPDYDRMTPEVAIQTRQQLPLNQAILTRLGELRAVSFRGVTQLGSDIYLANFANGSAEWRIGLAKDGSIGRIALGPQF
jgi:beta-lactamase regulating signal transducer with metallopeptidase domain